jgi:hypothetical protein
MIGRSRFHIVRRLITRGLHVEGSVPISSTAALPESRCTGIEVESGFLRVPVQFLLVSLT